MRFYPNYCCDQSCGLASLPQMIRFLQNRLETGKYQLVVIAKEDIPNAYNPSTGTGSFKIDFVKANNYCGRARCYIKAVDKKGPTGANFNTPGINFGKHKLALLTTVQMKDLWADGLGRSGIRKNGSYYGKLKWKVGCGDWLYAFDSSKCPHTRDDECNNCPKCTSNCEGCNNCPKCKVNCKGCVDCDSCRVNCEGCKNCPKCTSNCGAVDSGWNMIEGCNNCPECTNNCLGCKNCPECHHCFANGSCE